MKRLLLITILALFIVACKPQPASQPASVPAPAPEPQPAPAPAPEPQPSPAPAPTPEPAPTPSLKEVTIEADDRGFYPTNTITAEKGQTVRVTFKVRDREVYFGGLQIKGKEFNAGDIKPGASATVEFTPSTDSTFASYWPSSGVKKADGKIDVIE